MATPGSEQLWLWLGTAGMFIGMVVFIAMGWGEDDPKKQEVYAVTIFIPAIAFMSYLSMALGYGVTQVAVETSQGVQVLDIYWARYADWLFTTPLLLLDLALLAGASRSTIGTLIGLDVAMIVTGLIGALTGGPLNPTAPQGKDPLFLLGAPAQRLIWWGISTAFLLVLLYFLVGKISQQASKRSGEVASVFTTLRNLIIVLWLLYPVVWIIGTEGVLGDPGLVSLNVETAIFMVLDLSAKVGFGFILLRSRSAIEAATGSVDVGATAD